MTVENLVVNLVDQYKVEQLLAVKRYTDLYLAYDVDVDRNVTLDVLRQGNLPTGFAALFASRARAIAQIRHPNIARIFTVGRTASEQPYVAQAAIDGYALSHRLEQLTARPGTVNNIYALKLVRQLADALLLASRLDLLHYDLRPQNVMLKNVALPTDDVLVLTDLFVPFERRVWDADTEAVELVDYLSPEQRNGRDIEANSHVYTLGVLAYHLLAGTLPAGPTPGHEVLLRRMTTGGTALERARSGLSPETYDLVDRALRKDPRQRYDSIDEFIVALDQALLAEELLVGSAGRPVAAPTRRPWGIVTLLVVVALGTVASLTGARLMSRQSGGRQPLAALVTPGEIIASTAETDSAAIDNGENIGGGASDPVGDSVGNETPAAALGMPLANETPTIAATSTPTVSPTVPLPTSTLTATPTTTPEPSATSTEAPPTVTADPRVEVGLNAIFLRRGPGTSYPQIGSLQQGEGAVVLARFGEGEAAWFEVMTDEGVVGWLSASLVQLMSGITPEQIPTAASIPSTSTPTVTPTATPTATPLPVVTETPGSDGGDSGGGSVQPPAPTRPPVQPSLTPPPLTP